MESNSRNSLITMMIPKNGIEWAKFIIESELKLKHNIYSRIPETLQNLLENLPNSPDRCVLIHTGYDENNHYHFHVYDSIENLSCYIVNSKFHMHHLISKENPS